MPLPIAANPQPGLQLGERQIILAQADPGSGVVSETRKLAKYVARTRPVRGRQGSWVPGHNGQERHDSPQLARRYAGRFVSK